MPNVSSSLGRKRILDRHSEDLLVGVRVEGLIVSQRSAYGVETLASRIGILHTHRD
jgi:hypothetical protein